MLPQTHRWSGTYSTQGAKAAPGEQAGRRVSAGRQSPVSRLPKTAASPTAPNLATMVSQTHRVSRCYCTSALGVGPEGQAGARSRRQVENRVERARASVPSAPAWRLRRARTLSATRAMHGRTPVATDWPSSSAPARGSVFVTVREFRCTLSDALASPMQWTPRRAVVQTTKSRASRNALLLGQRVRPLLAARRSHFPGCCLCLHGCLSPGLREQRCVPTVRARP